MATTVDGMRDSFWRRACAGSLLAIWVLAPYLLIQKATMRGDLGEIHWLKMTWFEQVIAINLSSIWIYLSFYGLLILAGLKTEKREYLRYLRTVGWTAMVSHACYLIYPTGVSRVDVNAGEHWLYTAMVGFDAPVNAAPSLHASLSVVAGLALWRQKSHFMRALIWLWVLGILWSTIALRQHLAIDLITGASLACLCWFVSGRFGIQPHSLKR